LSSSTKRWSRKTFHEASTVKIAWPTNPKATPTVYLGQAILFLNLISEVTPSGMKINVPVITPAS
jgi:hypothetical protein